MNPNLPIPREQFEAKLTALLLGELPADEAFALGRAIEQDAELAKLYGRLKETIGLVRETIVSSAEQSAASSPALKLSDQRREKLLAHFKTVKPREFAEPEKRRSSWAVPLAAAAIVMLLGVLALPNFVKSRTTAQSNAIINNLRQLDGAKQQWALENHKSDDDQPTITDLSPYLRTGGLPSVAGEKYVVGKVGDPVAADLDRARAKKAFGEQAGTRLLARGKDQRLQLVESGDAVAFLPSERVTSQAASMAPPTEKAPEPVRMGIALPSVTNASGSFAGNPQWIGSLDKPGNGFESISIPQLAVVEPQKSMGKLEFFGLVTNYQSSSIGWADNTHSKQGNVGLADGSVDGFIHSRLQESLKNSGGGGIGGGGQTPTSTPYAPSPTASRMVLPFPSDTGIALNTPAQTAVPGETSAFRRRYGPVGGGGGGGGGAEMRQLKQPADVAEGFAHGPPIDPTTGLPVTSDAEIPTIDPTTGLPVAHPPVQPAATPAPSPSQPLGAEIAGKSLLQSNQVPVLGNVIALGDSFRGESKSADSRVRGLGGQTNVFSGNVVGYVNLPTNADDKIALPSAQIQTAVSEGLKTIPTRTLRLPGGQNPSGVTPPPVQNGRLLYESGRLDEAEAKLKEALKENPQDQAAYYYLNLAREARFKESLNHRDVNSRKGLVELEQAWATPPGSNVHSINVAGYVNLESTNGSRLPVQEKIPAGIINFAAVDLNQMLKIYSELVGRDIVRPTNLPAAQISVKTQMPLTREEAIQALDAVLAVNGVSAIPVGDKFLKVVPSAQANQTASSFNQETNAVQDGSKVTKVVQLQHVKPSELVNSLQPFAKEPNSFLPIESSQIVVLRESPENVNRMSDLIAKIDSNQASEYLSQAKVPNAAQQLNDSAKAKLKVPVSEPQPEIQTRNSVFSTFSLNVSDVSFKLAAASLEKGQMPEPASVRSEEFINAFDYRDPEPAVGVPIAFAWERARYPFAHNRDLLRFSIKTAAAGRQPGRPLNIVLLLDNSGSMERADRVRIIHEALRVLAGQLQAADKLSVVSFARTPRLWVDGLAGDQASKLAEEVSGLTPQGGTNLEEAMNLAYQTAARHYLPNGINRVVLLTDGAANLGDVEPESLKQKVEAQRKQGIALDCFGIGWEGFNDDLIEVLSRNGDGRYGFINTPEEAATEFAGQLAGALQVAASDVKVQVEFNPKRVTAYRQIGYAKHQLTKEQFRDNTVDAAEIGAAESGNALYVIETNPAGEGPLATVRVRYKVPGTSDYREQEWPVAYAGNAVSLEQASPVMRLAASASAFSEWLVSSPYAAEVTPDRLLGLLSGVPEVYGADARPKKLEWMIRQAKSVGGK